MKSAIGPRCAVLSACWAGQPASAAAEELCCGCRRRQAAHTNPAAASSQSRERPFAAVAVPTARLRRSQCSLWRWSGQEEGQSTSPCMLHPHVPARWWRTPFCCSVPLQVVPRYSLDFYLYLAKTLQINYKEPWQQSSCPPAVTQPALAWAQPGDPRRCPAVPRVGAPPSGGQRWGRGKEGRAQWNPECDFLPKCNAALVNKDWKRLLHCAT